MDEVFASKRERFGAARKDGARPFKHLAGDRLFALRDLRVNPIGFVSQ